MSDETILRDVVEAIIIKLKHQTLLHTELALLDRLIYRGNNQHAHHKSLQRLKQVMKCIRYFMSMELEDSLSSLLMTLPVKDYQQTKVELPTLVCLLQSIIFAAKLLARAIKYCHEAACHCVQMMQLSHFLPTNTLFFATASRLWVLCHSLVHEMSTDWYPKLYGVWMRHQNQKKVKEPASLPSSISEWLGPELDPFTKADLENNDRSSTLQRLLGETGDAKASSNASTTFAYTESPPCTSLLNFGKPDLVSTPVERKHLSDVKPMFGQTHSELQIPKRKNFFTNNKTFKKLLKKCTTKARVMKIYRYILCTKTVPVISYNYVFKLLDLGPLLESLKSLADILSVKMLTKDKVSDEEMAKLLEQHRHKVVKNMKALNKCFGKKVNNKKNKLVNQASPSLLKEFADGKLWQKYKELNGEHWKKIATKNRKLLQNKEKKALKNHVSKNVYNRKCQLQTAKSIKKEKHCKEKDHLQQFKKRCKNNHQKSVTSQSCNSKTYRTEENRISRNSHKSLKRRNKTDGIKNMRTTCNMKSLEQSQKQVVQQKKRRKKCEKTSKIKGKP